jgi:hypothetical protein
MRLGGRGEEILRCSARTHLIPGHDTVGHPYQGALLFASGRSHAAGITGRGVDAQVFRGVPNVALPRQRVKKVMPNHVRRRRDGPDHQRLYLSGVNGKSYDMRESLGRG